MKNYEKLNEIMGRHDSAEKKALGMLISRILDDHHVEYDDIDIEDYWQKYQKRLNWLNQEYSG